MSKIFSCPSATVNKGLIRVLKLETLNPSTGVEKYSMVFVFLLGGPQILKIPHPKKGLQVSVQVLAVQSR